MFMKTRSFTNDSRKVDQQEQDKKKREKEREKTAAQKYCEASHPVNTDPQMDANIRPEQQVGDVLLALLHHLI